MTTQGWLARVEHWGNRLPHPSFIFLLLALGTLALSWLAAHLGWQAQHPLTQQWIQAQSLISPPYLSQLFTQMVSNFTQFAPVGTVLVAMLGLGVAEHSGLLDSVLKRVLRHAKGALLTLVVVFTGVLSSLAVDTGYVLLIPLSGAIFAAAGRPPLAGIAAAFAGVSAGFSANLLVGPIDAILGGLSQEAAQLVEPTTVVPTTANYFFMIASTFWIVLLATWVTERWVLPRLEHSQAPTEDSAWETRGHERRGLIWAAVTLLLLMIALLALVLPESAPLRGPEEAPISQSPLMQGVVAVIFLAATLAGVAYGFAAGTFSSSHDIIRGMERHTATLASYLVMMFFAAQFIAYFNASQLGLLLAINAAEWLRDWAQQPLLLLLGLVLLTAVLNLLIGSASAKWALLAPIVVPTLMLLQISPEASQAAYRIGDGVTNIISPLMPYFPLVVAFVQRYQPQAGLGTVLALMLPYSLVLLLGWSLLLVLWFTLGWPLGPSSGFQY